MKLKPMIVMMLLPVVGMAQDRPDTKKAGPVLPGKGHVRVENLNKKLDLDMDISHLSISELHVLRNAPAARQGYNFKDATLNALFSSTTWYTDTMMKRWDFAESAFAEAMEKRHKDDYQALTEQERRAIDEQVKKRSEVHYTVAEQAFMKRLQAREDELRQLNFRTKAGCVVNTDNIVNPYQLESIEQPLMDMLGRQGFAIVPAQHRQLFHVYEKNDYSDFPSFVTTDLFLQLFHLYFDASLREVEEQRLLGTMTELCRGLYRHFSDGLNQLQGGKGAALRDDVGWCQAYFAVALRLLTDKLPPVNAAYKDMAKEEVDKVLAAENDQSRFLGPDYFGLGSVQFSYSLFRPRGHYTRSEQAGRYFRAMMWLQSVPLATGYPEQLRRAALIAEALCQPDLLAKYQSVAEPLTYLMGAPDNITILQVGEEWRRLGGKLGSKKSLQALRRSVEEIAERQTRIRPLFAHTSKYKVNFMPQRYQPDGEAMLKVVDAKNFPSRREAPMGVDIMAAMGSKSAQEIQRQMPETSEWEGFQAGMDTARAVMQRIHADSTIANHWMRTLLLLSDSVAGAPYFMRTPQWGKKCLNAMLASWAELKHDAILYAKQPIEAECGGGGPEPPVLKGYVEPNLAFWQEAIRLVDETMELFSKYNLVTPKLSTTTERIRELAEFCLAITQKELAGKEPTDEEYNQIKIIGATMENISLELVSDKDEMLQGWDEVSGADKSVAIVADVFTVNGDNVPDERHRVLYEATGPAYEIYVVVEIGGYLYLTRGAVLSYREFCRAVNEPRMTDEEWQKALKTHPHAGEPEWMQEIIAPVKGMPDDNEEVFYSSGC